jgi:hypothetical protein
MGNIKTNAIVALVAFTLGYGTKWTIDYFAAKKAAATDDKEDEAAE